MSLLRSKSMAEIYGNTPSNIEGIHHVSSAPEGRPLANVNTSDPEPPALLSRTSLLGAADMYLATLQGNWSDAKRLLAENPGLSHGPITRVGDRALHVAVAMGHKEFVQNIVEQVSEGNVRTLLDGRGYTACCYAAVSGAQEIAEILMENRPSVITSRDAKKDTLLHKAASFGKKKMVQYFLNLTRKNPENLSQQEWFDLLLTLINKKMFDVALEIVKMDGSVAHMRNDEGTALHALARLHVPEVQAQTTLLDNQFGCYYTLLCGLRTKIDPADSVTQKDIRLLAERLWAEIQKLEQYDAIELMIKPSILHEAAERGNVELIIMLSQTYPELIWHRDDKGYSIFHIAAIHGRENIFKLSDQNGTEKELAEISQDSDGNNILHLAAQLSTATARRREASPVLELKQKLKWFELVRANVTPLCLNMRNEEGLTPREFFSKQHASLLGKSEALMRRTAENSMLIATIILTMVFTALFTVPGGNNQDTGFPIFYKRKLFILFLGHELFAFIFSSITIIMFWSILTGSFEVDQFISYLPKKLIYGLEYLMYSFICTISAFLSTFVMAIDKSEAFDRYVLCTILPVFLVSSVGFFNLLRRMLLWYANILRKRLIPSSPGVRPSSDRIRLFSSIN